MADDSGDLLSRFTPKNTVERDQGGDRGLGPLSVLFLALLLMTSTSVGLVAVGSEEASAQSGFSSGDVELDVFAPENTFTPGQTSELTLEVANSGEINSGSSPESTDTTTTARNVRVAVDAEDAPISVETGEKPVGNIGAGAHSDVPIEIDVPEDAEPGEYEIEVELEYRHTSRVFDVGGTQGDRSHTVTREIDIVIDDAPRFDLTELNTTAQIDGSGTLTAEIENVGSQRADDITVDLTASSQQIDFGGDTSESASVGSLAPGATATIDYDVTFGASASQRGYPINATVSYEDPNGISGIDTQPTLDVTPMAEQTFRFDSIDSTLRVGEDGDLTGTLTNTGPVPTDSVVVRYADDSSNIIPVEETAAIGTLEAGESASFRMPIEVGTEAEAGPKLLDFDVRYRDRDRDQQTYGDLDALAEVAPERDRFDIEILNRTLEAGGSRSIEIAVTSNLDETATDVEARLFADDPLDTGDTDTGYTQSLDSSETATMTFELTSTGSATPGSTYPISVDIRYDDADGDSQLSDTYRVPIDVIESEDGGLPLPVVLVGLLIAGTGVLVWYRRRQANSDVDR